MIDDPAETGTEPPRRRGLVGGVIGRVAPVVMRQIDMDAVVGQLDVNAIAAQLDLDALMARLDMDALVDRLDVNLVADKLDLDALMARLDMDALVDRLDVNLVAENLDLDALMTRIDMAQLTAGATQDVAVSGLDLLRRQLVRADATVDGVVGRVMRRTAGERPETPTGLADAAAVEIDTSDGDEAGDLRRRDVSGHYAGPVTRLLALTGDISAAFASYGFVGAVTLYFLSTFTGIDVTFGSGGWVSRVLVVAWVVAWFWIPVAAFGRTLAMAVVGVAVVRRDGKVANSRRALVRALVLPVSVAILLLGLLGMVIGRERRTLHDAAAGTVVVYDWGAREAEQPVSIREQLSARVRRREERLDA